MLLRDAYLGRLLRYALEQATEKGTSVKVTQSGSIVTLYIGRQFIKVQTANGLPDFISDYAASLDDDDNWSDFKNWGDKFASLIAD